VLCGYARVSTLDQNPALQLDALTGAGCEQTWTDHATGTSLARPQWAALDGQLRAGARFEKGVIVEREQHELEDVA
jgi:DNA invertase Pin-like site-specific DNA recombinase